MKYSETPHHAKLLRFALRVLSGAQYYHSRYDHSLLCFDLDRMPVTDIINTIMQIGFPACDCPDMSHVLDVLDRKVHDAQNKIDVSYHPLTWLLSDSDFYYSRQYLLKQYRDRRRSRLS